MRKVLFATTALVALGGVSAATADISVSAANEAKYKSWSSSTATTANNNSLSNTTSYKISASTVADNGLTMSSYILQDETTAAWDDMGFSIGGDFGTLGFAGSESGDAFATATDVTPDEDMNYTAANITSMGTFKPADENVAAADVSYLSPDISGFQFAIGMDQGGSSDATIYGAQYSMTSGDASITVKYAASSGAKASAAATDVEATSLGLVVGYGDMTITLADNTKTKGTTYDYSAQSVGVTYAASDVLTLSAYTGSTEDGKDATHDVSDTGVGLAYTITPGLSLSVTYNDWDIKDTTTSYNEDGSITSVALNLSF
jgi:hypothetical protein